MLIMVIMPFIFVFFIGIILVQDKQSGFLTPLSDATEILRILRIASLDRSEGYIYTLVIIYPKKYYKLREIYVERKSDMKEKKTQQFMILPGKRSSRRLLYPKSLTTKALL